MVYLSGALAVHIEVYFHFFIDAINSSHNLSTGGVARSEQRAGWLAQHGTRVQQLPDRAGGGIMVVDLSGGFL